MAKAKKPVIDMTNPAMSFMSSIGTEPDNQVTASGTTVSDIQIPEGYKLVPITEARTRRVQLVMQPSLYDWAKKTASDENLTFNDYIHKLLERERKEKSK